MSLREFDLARRRKINRLLLAAVLLPVVAAAIVALVLGGHKPTARRKLPTAGHSHAAAATTPAQPPASTAPSSAKAAADAVMCAQTPAVAMRAGPDHSILNSVRITPARQQAEAGQTACEPAVSMHIEQLEMSVWTRTAQAGFPSRSGPVGS